VVTEVAEDSVAARSHIQPGDVITSIDGYAIEDVDSFNKIVRNLTKKRSLPVRIIRQGRPGYVAIRIDK
jgi:serine protease Do